MVQSVLGPEAVEGERRIRREDNEVVEEVEASSYSSLTYHYETIVAVALEKSLEALSWHVHGCEGNHDLWSHLNSRRLCYLAPLQMMTLSNAAGISTH